MWAIVLLRAGVVSPVSRALRNARARRVLQSGHACTVSFGRAAWQRYAAGLRVAALP